MSLHRIEVPVHLICDYQLQVPKDREARHLFILLHGYSESGGRILNKLASHLPEDSLILAPNAPFPMPQKTDDGYKVGFAWYFYDPRSQEYFIDTKTAVEFVSGLVKKLGYEKLEKTLIGFSQGGYLAPFVAQELGNVKQVVGIACEFLSEELRGEIPFRMDLIHGEQDEVVTVEDARTSHMNLVARKIPGDFHLLSGVGHRIEEKVQKKVKELLG